MSKTWLYLENDIELSGFDLDKDFEYVGDFLNPMNFQTCSMFSRTAQTKSSGFIEGLTLVIPMVLKPAPKQTYNR